jgi:hypothetical protein
MRFGSACEALLSRAATRTVRFPCGSRPISSAEACRVSVARRRLIRPNVHRVPFGARFHASMTSSAPELLRRGETRSHAFAREHSPVGVRVPRPTLRPARDHLSRGFPPPRSASLLIAERYLLAVGQPPAHRFSPAATNEGVDFEVFFTAEMLTFARCYPRARSLPSSGSPPLGSYPWTRLRLPGDPPVTLAPRSSQNEGRMRSPSAFLRPEEQLRRHRLTDPLEVWSLPSLARWRGSSRRPTVRKTDHRGPSTG